LKRFGAPRRVPVSAQNVDRGAVRVERPIPFNAVHARDSGFDAFSFRDQRGE